MTLNNRDLKKVIEGNKLVLFENMGAVSYSPSTVTMAVSLTLCEIFSVIE